MTSAPSALRPEPSGGRTALFLALALCAFAANSILCRAALGPGFVDAATFTGVRLLSGAVVLVLIARWRSEPLGGGSWRGGLALCGYAVAFALAYTRIATGTGALILFGTVQATMLAAALVRGERISWTQWIGITAALGGLTALFLPGQHAPDVLGAALMVGAGVAWGAYSLLGRGALRPLATTAHNFCWSLPLAALFVFVERDSLHTDARGIALAASSGAVASGLGYTMWYAALRTTSTTRAAVLQLAVPVIAALGGVALLGESLGMRFIVCGALVLGGVALAVARGDRSSE